MELKEIVGYLPYELKAFEVRRGDFENSKDVKSVVNIGVASYAMLFRKRYRVKSCKPILKPLSSLTKKALGEYYQDLTDYHLDCIKEDTLAHPLHQSYIFTEWLLSKHFDIHGLTEKGEAVDFNTLQEGK